MNLAIIPARGGSKRVPRKNIKLFYGKPMIAWSIEAAKCSGLFSRIVVSTDDLEIAETAQKWGAEIPFLRPAELSHDHAGSAEVITHAVKWAQNQGEVYQAVCCLYATAPFIQVKDLQQGLETLEAGDWKYAFAVTDFAAPIFRSFRLLPEGGIEMFFPEHFLTRSQDLPVAYHDAGQFYWARPETWIAGLSVFENHSAPIFIPRWRVQDIDSQADWERAEMLAPQILQRPDEHV